MELGTGLGQGGCGVEACVGLLIGECDGAGGGEGACAAVGALAVSGHGLGVCNADCGLGEVYAGGELTAWA